MGLLRRLGLAVGVLLALAAPAGAAEVYIIDGIGLKGHDPVAYFAGKALAGDPALRHEHLGVAYLFASAENRAAFAADPARYLPQYGGYCAYGVSRGYKADVDPTAFTVVDGKLYLNYSPAVMRDWRKDTAGYIQRADDRWGEVRKIDKVLR